MSTDKKEFCNRLIGNIAVSEEDIDKTYGKYPALSAVLCLIGSAVLGAVGVAKWGNAGYSTGLKNAYKVVSTYANDEMKKDE